MDLVSALENIYISPLETCNLSCKYCYTPKTKNRLTNRQILTFVTKYKKFLSKARSYDFFSTLSLGTDSPEKKNYNKGLNLKSIIFCGGEVFTLKNFPNLVNQLLSQSIFISIISNGTIDRLTEIHDPRNCQLIVSFDGPQKVHDHNRGSGNFQKSYQFVDHAIKLGFPVEIFYLITKDSYPFKDSLNIFNQHKTYLTDRLASLTPSQLADIRNNYPCFPPKNFHCHQLSLQSNGQIYGCCESQLTLGKITDPLDQTINNFFKLLIKSPSCYDPQFHCQL